MKTYVMGAYQMYCSKKFDIFLIFQWKHMLRVLNKQNMFSWRYVHVLLISTHSICFHGDIWKILIFWISDAMNVANISILAPRVTGSFLQCQWRCTTWPRWCCSHLELKVQENYPGICLPLSGRYLNNWSYCMYSKYWDTLTLIMLNKLTCHTHF